MEKYRLNDRVRHRQYTEATGRITHLSGIDVQITMDPVEGDTIRRESPFSLWFPLLGGSATVNRFPFQTHRIVVVNKDLFPHLFEKVEEEMSVPENTCERCGRTVPTGEECVCWEDDYDDDDDYDWEFDDEDLYGEDD